MKKSKSILSLAISSLFAVAVLAGCGTGGQTNAGNGQAAAPAAPATQPAADPATSAKPKMVMSTSADYKPYEFHDLTSGKDEIVGFDIDLAKYIANELGFELEIKDMNFDGLIPALQTGRTDFVMAGMSPKPERLKNADFSDIYYDSVNSIVSKTDSKLDKPEDLTGKKVAVQTGSIQETYLTDLAKTVKGIQVVSLNKIPEMVEEVKIGRVDAAIIEDTVAKGFVAANPQIQYKPFPDTEKNGSAVAFPKGSKHVEEFNKVIKKMQENGEMDKLIKKWFAQ